MHASVTDRLLPAAYAIMQMEEQPLAPLVTIVSSHSLAALLEYLILARARAQCLPECPTDATLYLTYTLAIVIQIVASAKNHSPDSRVSTTKHANVETHT